MALHVACLTIENLLRRGFNMPSRCCLCYKDCETSADALGQYTFVKAVVDMFLNIFGVQWAMPKTVGATVDSWQ